MTLGDVFAELGMRFMSKSLNAECREAIEALEAVQKHAFAVRYTQEGSHADHNEPGPPDVDFEDAGSEDEMHSEPGSRQPSMTHVSIPPWSFPSHLRHLKSVLKEEVSVVCVAVHWLAISTELRPEQCQ